MSAFQPKQTQPPQLTSSDKASPKGPAHSISHHENPILNLQRTIGNQAVLRLLQVGAQPGEVAYTSGSGAAAGHSRFTHNFASIPVFHTLGRGLQCKLTVNTLGDAYEQEADRVSEQVMRMPEPSANVPGGPESSKVFGGVAGVQRACACGGTCDACKKKHPEDGHAHVQMKAFGPADAGGIEAPHIVHEVLLSAGRPLDAATRAFMEPRFGADFSQVRVHTDVRAADTARSMQAKAFNVGHDISFGSGQYAPESSSGKLLLAHELTHVVQQSGGGLKKQRISKAGVSVQRDLLDDLTDGLTSVGSAVSEGVENVGSAVASGVETVGSAVTSGLDSVTSAVASGAKAVGSAVESGTQAVGGVVGSAKKQVEAVLDPLIGAAAEGPGLIPSLQDLHVDWNSAPAMTVKSWASRLSSETVRDIRGKNPAALYSLVDIPIDVQQASEELAKQVRTDFQPPVLRPPVRVPPGLDPGLKPGLDPGAKPGLRPLPLPLLAAIIIFIIIMLIPANIFQTNTEDEKLKEGKKKEEQERKKKNEEEEGTCRATIPSLGARIHQVMIQLLDRNANDYLDARLGDTPRNRQSFGDFLFRNEFFFFLAVVRQTKNTILKVCSLEDNTLATAAGDKLIHTLLHAEELAAPSLIGQLQAVPLQQRAGGTLFNVCQSAACAQNARNPDGCTAVLNNIKNTLLPGGQVLDAPVGFPANLRAETDAALFRQLEARLPND